VTPPARSRDRGIMYRRIGSRSKPNPSSHGLPGCRNGQETHARQDHPRFYSGSAGAPDWLGILRPTRCTGQARG